MRLARLIMVAAGGSDRWRLEGWALACPNQDSLGPALPAHGLLSASAAPFRQRTISCSMLQGSVSTAQKRRSLSQGRSEMAVPVAEGHKPTSHAVFCV